MDRNLHANRKGKSSIARELKWGKVIFAPVFILQKKHDTSDLLVVANSRSSVHTYSL